MSLRVSIFMERSMTRWPDPHTVQPSFHLTLPEEPHCRTESSLFTEVHQMVRWFSSCSCRLWRPDVGWRYFEKSSRSIPPSPLFLRVVPLYDFPEMEDAAKKKEKRPPNAQALRKIVSEMVSAGPFVGLFYHVLEGEHLDFRDTVPLTLVKAWAPGAAGMREALKSRHGVLEKYDCQLFYAQGGEGQGRSRGEGEFSELITSTKSEPDIIYIKAILKSSMDLSCSTAAVGRRDLGTKALQRLTHNILHPMHALQPRGMLLDAAREPLLSGHHPYKTLSS